MANKYTLKTLAIEIYSQISFISNIDHKRTSAPARARDNMRLYGGGRMWGGGVFGGPKVGLRKSTKISCEILHIFLC